MRAAVRTVNSKRSRRNSVDAAKLAHELRKLSKRHRLMVTALGRPIGLRHAITHPLHHPLDALFHTLCRFWRRRPDRCQRLSDERSVDYEIGRLHKVEAWSLRRVLRHCWRCLELRHVGSCGSMNRRAASLKSIGSGARLASRASYLTSIGSLPSRINCRACLARTLASARLTVCSGPRPICRARPLIMYLNSQALVPL